jgi:hypothetical protein
MFSSIKTFLGNLRSAKNDRPRIRRQRRRQLLLEPLEDRRLLAFGQQFSINGNEGPSLDGAIQLAALAEEFQVPIKQARPFELNSLLRDHWNVHVKDSIVLGLFPGRSFSAVVETKATDVNGTAALVAKLQDYDFAYGFISVSGEEYFVSVDIPELGEKYVTRVHPETRATFLVQLDLEGPDELAGGPPLTLRDEGNDSLNPVLPVGNSDLPMAAEPPVGEPLNAPVRIDVMVVYTPAARAWADTNEGGINNTIAAAMSRANLASTNSDLGLTYNLVYSGEVSYTEADSSTDLTRLRGTTDGYMEEVHDLRNEHAADLVALLTFTQDTGGLGYLLQARYGRDDTGFSLTRVQQASWTYTLVHEIGHNMGAHHHKLQTEQPGPTEWSDWPENQWSAGWRWRGDDGKYYRDLMTYSGSYFPDGAATIQIPYFSSPDIDYQGQPTGHTLDGDNARTLREVKQYLAYYRDATTLQYCAAQGGNANYGISRVRLGSIDQSAGTNPYYDFSFRSTDLLPGAVEPLIVTVHNPFSGNRLLVWVDWNDDQEFQSHELVYQSGTGAVAEYTTTITAPVDTAPGPKRMRIRLHTPASGGNSTPCGSNTHGEVQDFTVTVSAGTTAPEVIVVTSPIADGAYKAGAELPITVGFNKPVYVTGTPQLTLKTGDLERVVHYTNGSGTDTLTFVYLVQAGDTSSDLDYASDAALVLNGGTIRSAADVDAILILPEPGAAGSLGYHKNLVIDTTAPAVTIGRATGQDDPTGESPINFTVVFSEPVTGFGTGDVGFAGSTAPGTLVGTVTGSGTTYHVAVAGMTGSGTVIVSLAEGVAEDAAGNPSLASTGTDNSVQYNVTEIGLVAGDLAFADTTSTGRNDTITLSLVHITGIDYFRFASHHVLVSTVAGSLNSGTTTVDVPVSVIADGKKLVFNTGAGDDILTVDFSGGDPIPAGGLLFNGSAGSDALRIVGTGGQNPVYAPDAATFGNGTIEFGASKITFSGVEPVEFDSVGTFTLQLPADDDLVDIRESTMLAGNSPALWISGSSGGEPFGSIRVRGSAMVIDTVTGGDGNDTITITSAGNDHRNVSLTIVSGAGADSVAVHGAATFAGFVDVRTTDLSLTPAGTLTGGSITLAADRMDISPSARIIATDTVFLHSSTAGRSIDLGGADSSTELGLSGGELDSILAPALKIGADDSGTIIVSADIARAAATDLTLTSGADIAIRSGQLDTGGGTLRLVPGAAPAGVRPTKAEVDATVGTLSFGGDLIFEINGAEVDADYTQLGVAGAVDLSGTVLVITSDFPALTGFETFAIVSATSVFGAFTGLADGDLVHVQDQPFVVKYHSDRVLLVPDNRPPTADAGGPYTLAEGQSFHWDASGSTDLEDGNQDLVFEWDLDYDGHHFRGSVSGERPEVRFPDNFDRRTIAVRVTDTGGKSDVATATLTVANVAPGATIEHHGPVPYGQAVSVSLVHPYDPSEADTAAGFRYAFVLDADEFVGISYGSGATVASSRQFPGLAAGSHTVHARIYDKDDGYTQYATNVHVAQASLTVKADDKTKMFGDPEPGWTYTVSGTLLYGDTAAVVSGVVLSGPTGDQATLGTHPIQANGGQAANYAITHVPGTLTVTVPPTDTGSGNVTARVSRGSLAINGDNLSNSIAVTFDAATGQWIVSGIGDTTVEGELQKTFAGVSRDVVIRMNGGNDYVLIQNAAFPRNLRVETGAGNNRTVLASVQTGGHAAVRHGSGSGNDVYVFSSLVGGNLELTGGVGSDRVYVLDTRVERNLTARLGGGADLMQIHDAHVGRDLDVRLGGGGSHYAWAETDLAGGGALVGDVLGVRNTRVGRDHLVQTNTRAGDAATVWIFSDEEVLEFDDPSGEPFPRIGRDANLRGGAGDDTIGLRGTKIGRDLRLDTGSGTDAIDLLMNSIGRNANTKLGSGSNEVAIDGLNVAALFSLTGGRDDDQVLVGTRSESGLTATTARFSMGSGADTVALLRSDLVDLTVSMDAGDDRLYMQETRVTGKTTLRGGRGNDGLTGDLFDQNPLASLDEREFEYVLPGWD